MLSVTGNSFNIREALKSAGGRWNSTAKTWEFEDSQLELLKFYLADKNVRLYKDKVLISLNPNDKQLSLL